MSTNNKWRLESFIKDLVKSGEYELTGFTAEELEENINEWNKFFEEKRFTDHDVAEVVDHIIGVIGRNIVFKSRDDQFYAQFYVRREADNPPLLKKQLLKKVENHNAEYWTGKYVAELADPKNYPNCVRDYTSCNAIKYGTGVFDIKDPARLGLTYFKLSNFQIEAAKIAIELVEYFEKLYGVQIPEQPTYKLKQNEAEIKNSAEQQEYNDLPADIASTVERINAELQLLFSSHHKWWEVRKKLYVSNPFASTDLGMPSDWKGLLPSELVDTAIQDYIWKHFLSAVEEVFNKEEFARDWAERVTSTMRFKNFDNKRLLYSIRAKEVTSEDGCFDSAVTWKMY